MLAALPASAALVVAGFSAISTERRSRSRTSPCLQVLLFPQLLVPSSLAVPSQR